MHALDGVTVTYEVPPDDVRNGGVVVDDEDPPRPVGQLRPGWTFGKRFLHRHTHHLCGRLIAWHAGKASA